jgi:hypothetical protein
VERAVYVVHCHFKLVTVQVSHCLGVLEFFLIGLRLRCG